MRVHTVLLEYQRQKTIQAFKQGLLTALARDRSAIDYIYIRSDSSDEQRLEHLMNILEMFDPTQNKVYMRWIARQYARQDFLIEDGETLREDLSDFHRYKSLIPERDILKYQTVDDLVRMLAEYEHLFPAYKSKKQAKKEISQDIRNQSEILYDGDLGILVVPRTQEASCFWGQNSRWCTAATNDNRFHFYNQEGNLYIWIDRNTGKKYQFHWETLDLANEANQKLYRADPETLDYFRNQHPVLKKLFKAKEEQLLKTARKDDLLTYTKYVIRGPWPGLEDKISDNPNLVYYYVMNIINDPNSNNPERYPPAEKVLIDDPYVAVRYAQYVIKGRWFEAESNILSSAEASKAYYQEVTKGDWPEYEGRLLARAEDDISASGGVSTPVMTDILNIAYRYRGSSRRWPRAEPYIARAASPDFTLEYSADHLQSAWRNSGVDPETARVAEQNILMSANLRIPVVYAAAVLKQRWPELEKRMKERIDDKSSSNWYYVRDYLNEFDLSEEILE